MGIAFYLFLASFALAVIFLIKIMTMKIEIRNIEKSLNKILGGDTNALITTFSNDDDLKSLAKSLNFDLKLLRKAKIGYEQGNSDLKTSVTNISHDLRTPLTAIHGYLELMKNEQTEEKRRMYFSVIENKVSELISLTEQLFDYSKRLDTYDKINKKPLLLNSALEDAVCGFYAVFEKNGIKPNVDICKERVIKTLDETFVKRIFENVISNAVKYTKGDIDIKLTSDGTVTFANPADYIDSVSLNRIFDRYYTVSNSKKSNGIGLSIAKQLTELSGGGISAEYKDKMLVVKINFN